MMLLAIILTIVMYSYWYICRKSSLQVREKLADKAVEYLEDESSSENFKTVISLAYRWAGRWWLFPFIAIVTPFTILLAKDSDINQANGVIGEKEDLKFKEIMDLMISMCVKRNPIISICSAAVGFSIAAVLILIKIAFGRFKNIPSITTSLMAVVNLLSHIRKKLHA